MARSLTSRPIDILYLAFFIIHIPIVIFIDSFPLWPPALRMEWMKALRLYYIQTYKDFFFIDPPAWFGTYMWMELIYHLPLSLWAVPAIIRDDPKIPLHLLIYGCQTAVTTLTCISEYLSWPGYTSQEKLNLGYLYVPYLVLSVFMTVDMFRRLDRTLGLISMRFGNAGKKKQ
ncbi:hypothetical protein P152DRAFT_415194 [Eremomyces bilateralis CBS 781.70]|uniref:Efficient mitochondria targeting-associated protein 19 n=1 Tax=Eremomyces bilateralis CBS 781.70 TaxID=1392243 RepID=A0A6G1G5H4_9PEZI|nr:uncharacterized protein P152DRAFT_415194 [Eremomyces bilateralis CBS 781.70]KAF1813317.1 hypothetical protein P152DRAFT_415194 [Eremomyces bilateralis CBS 781.70]